MEHLMRELAPITESTWQLLDDEVTETLASRLVARKIFDVGDPMGWQVSSIDCGRTRELKNDSCVSLSLRNVQPLIELKVEFEVDRNELNALARGASDPRLDSLEAAAMEIAAAEDQLVFKGLEEANIIGALPKAQKSKTIDASELPGRLASGISELRSAGIDGPYALAIPPVLFADLNQATEGGYPVLKHAERLVDYPIIWAPTLEQPVLTSCRGGDLKICLGADFAVGYLGHDRDKVCFFIEELLTFENNTPEACVSL